MQNKRVFWLRDETDTQNLGILTYDTETSVYGMRVEPGISLERLPLSLRILQRRQDGENGATAEEQHEIAKAWVMSRIPAERCHTDAEIFSYLLLHSGRCPLDSIYMLEVTGGHASV